MKSRRDITLGEMQDECKKYWNNGNFGYCGKCQYMSVCCHYERYCPAQLNLTDPPRFTEAQMAFFRGWFGVGARSVRFSDGFMLFDQANEYHPAMVCKIPIGWDASFEKQDERIYLAELLGKDGAE